jgi:hypothetical protein
MRAWRLQECMVIFMECNVCVDVNKSVETARVHGNFCGV